MHTRPKKSLGQNFLTDPHYLRRIVETAGVGPDDQVLEIGPGLGHLTRELAARAGRVLALELDARLVPVLSREFAGRPAIRILEADALAYPYDELDGSWKVVANLPYYISTPLLQRFISFRRKFSSLTVMLQKEVAERIVAPPGGKDYGFLSVLVQYYTLPRTAFMVPAGAFTPRPKVDSAVVHLAVLPRPAAPAGDEAYFITVVKAAFSQRRKTLRNALGQLGLTRAALDLAERRSGIALSRRAETLTVADFSTLADLLRQAPVTRGSPED